MLVLHNCPGSDLRQANGLRLGLEPGLVHHNCLLQGRAAKTWEIFWVLEPLRVQELQSAASCLAREKGRALASDLLNCQRARGQEQQIVQVWVNAQGRVNCLPGNAPEFQSGQVQGRRVLPSAPANCQPISGRIGEKGAKAVETTGSRLLIIEKTFGMTGRDSDRKT